MKKKLGWTSNEAAIRAYKCYQQFESLVTGYFIMGKAHQNQLRQTHPKAKNVHIIFQSEQKHG